MKVQLINPPTDYSDEYQHGLKAGLSLGYDRVPPPLGLIYLKSAIGSLASVEIIDGNLHSLDNIIRSNYADVVGCSDIFTSHRNALTILEEAKKRGATTVLGGPNASNLAKLIIKNYDFVDYVVVGDGETAMRDIISGKMPKGIVEGKHENLDTLSFLDLGGIEGLEVYDSRNQEYDQENLTPFPTSFTRGCIKLKRCPYCAVSSGLARVTDPENVWAQLATLREEHGIRYFIETGDDFMVGDYPERLVAAKPKGLDIEYRVYVRPETNLNVETLRKIGVSEVFIGVEHISPEVLKYIKKSHTKDRIRCNLKALEDSGMQAHLAFLFGLPHETEATARENADFAVELVENFANIKRVLYTIAVPLAGSRWYNVLLKNLIVQDRYQYETGKILRQDDNPNYRVLQEASLEQFSEIDYYRLKDIILVSQRRIEAKIGREKIAGFGQVIK